MSVRGRKLTWFRLYSTQSAALCGIDSFKLGEALKATLQYFETGIPPQINDPVTNVGFQMLRAGVDDSVAEYIARREDGKRGAEARREKMNAVEEQIEELYARFGGDEPQPNAVDL